MAPTRCQVKAEAAEASRAATDQAIITMSMGAIRLRPKKDGGGCVCRCFDCHPIVRSDRISSGPFVRVSSSRYAADWTRKARILSDAAIDAGLTNAEQCCPRDGSRQAVVMARSANRKRYWIEKWRLFRDLFESPVPVRVILISRVSRNAPRGQGRGWMERPRYRRSC